MTDRAWARIEPLLPKPGGRGGRWADRRKTINGILWRERTGAPWPDMPSRYGKWQTVYNRLRRWSLDGTWEWILDHVVVKNDAVGDVEWVVSVDSTVVRAHQHAAGAPHRIPKDQEDLKRGMAPSTTAHETNAPGWRGSAGPAAD
jgi:transposase